MIAASEQGDGTNQAGASLQLPAILDLNAAGPLATAFLARRGADIIISAGDVQRLGGQCLQVLLSARGSWREDGRSMRIDSPSPELISALELFGIRPEMFLHQEESIE